MHLESLIDIYIDRSTRNPWHCFAALLESVDFKNGTTLDDGQAFAARLLRYADEEVSTARPVTTGDINNDERWWEDMTKVKIAKNL